MPENTIPRRLRASLAVVAALVLLAAGAVAVMGAAAEAAKSGRPFLLGKANKATKVTRLTSRRGPALLVRAKQGPALRLKSKGGPALELSTSSGPAFSVGTTDLVRNLNADAVDGKHLDALEPVTQVLYVGTTDQAGTGDFVGVQTVLLPSGTYEFNIHGLVGLGDGDTAECVVVDATRFNADGYAAVFAAADQAEDAGESLVGHGVGTVRQGNVLQFACVWEETSTLRAPIQFTLRHLDRVGPVPGTGPVTRSKALSRLVR